MNDTTEEKIKVAPGVWVDKSLVSTFDARRRLLLLDDDGYEAIGLKPKHADTMRRLCEIGLIRICMISPRVWFLDVDSWEDHVDACLDDPFKWDKSGKIIKAYRETYRP